MNLNKVLNVFLKGIGKPLFNKELNLKRNSHIIFYLKKKKNFKTRAGFEPARGYPQ